MNEGDAGQSRSIKRRVHEILEVASEGDRASRIFDVFILGLIVANVLATVCETVDDLHRRFRWEFATFEIASIAIFSVEYVARLWSVTSSPRFARPVAGRLRFMTTPLAVVDLLAILPFFVAAVGGLDLRFVRILRVFRLFRLLKLARYVKSVHTLAEVVKAKKEELLVAVTFALILLVFASSLLYFTEHETQPLIFSSIPAAMWWGVCTLTTVGYGDVYPVTPLGQLLGGTISIIGVGVFALPAGILASGFTERIQRNRSRPCPHCGNPADQPAAKSLVVGAASEAEQ